MVHIPYFVYRNKKAGDNLDLLILGVSGEVFQSKNSGCPFELVDVSSLFELS